MVINDRSIRQYHALNRSRACNEWQMQQAVILKNGEIRKAAVIPAEYAEYIDEDKWRILCKKSPLLLLSAKRGELLGITAINGAVALDITDYSLEQLWQLIAGKYEQALKQIETPESGELLISLAKEARLLPALLWFQDLEVFSDAFELEEASLQTSESPELLAGEVVSLPIGNAENTRIIGFKTRFTHDLHLALIIGDLSANHAENKPPLLRVHSSCVTGDLLGSLRCDCGDQLRLSLAKIKEEGVGILLYLHQEGRNIGIINKLRAYALQEGGIDTFAANNHLGFDDDERDYEIAVEILKHIKCEKLRLLTNNPQKPKAFAESGIMITEIIPLKIKPNEHNANYIKSKEERQISTI